MAIIRSTVPPSPAGIAERMGLSTEDQMTLEKLVRHHLLLPDIATRRDLEDPVTLNLVAEAVGDQETLELLRVLAAADGEATGTAAWSPWKAGLVNELAERTAAVLAGRPAPPGTAIPIRRTAPPDEGGGFANAARR